MLYPNPMPYQMKRFNLRKMFFLLWYSPAILRENRQLKMQVKDIAKYRNDLLGIIATNTNITDVTGNGEPLFIASKSLSHSMVFNIYDYNPRKLASAKVTLNGMEWQLADIEIPENTPAHLRTILMRHIEREGKRLKVMGTI